MERPSAGMRVARLTNFNSVGAPLMATLTISGASVLPNIRAEMVFSPDFRLTPYHVCVTKLVLLSVSVRPIKVGSTNSPLTLNSI